MADDSLSVSGYRPMKGQKTAAYFCRAEIPQGAVREIRFLARGIPEALPKETRRAVPGTRRGTRENSPADARGTAHDLLEIHLTAIRLPGQKTHSCPKRHLHWGILPRETLPALAG